MNRLTAKLVHGLARLAFWRKPVETSPEQSLFPDPAMASRLNATEAETGVTVEVPVLRAVWFARLKQVLRRRRDPVQEPSLEPDQTGVRARPSRKQVEENAAADVVPLPKLPFLGWLKIKLRRQPKPEQLEADVDADALKPGAEKNSQATAPSDSSPDDDEAPSKPSFLGRLKNTFRRQPKPEQLEADANADALKPGADKDNKATASSEASPDDDADAVQTSRIRRVGAMLSNQSVWIPSASIVLLAIMIAMLLMLLQSAQEKKQLQTKLIATQKKLEQTSTVKRAAARKKTPRQAGDPANVTLGSAADIQPGVDAGDCVVTDKESVIKNLKNCIDSFNNDMSQ